MLVVGWLSLVASDPFAQAEDLFARVRRLNPTLADYQATAEVKLDARVGPLQDQRTLAGTYYYKREGHHKLDLPAAPGYLKRQSNIFGFSLPRLERYQVRELTAARLAGRKAWRLQLVPRTPQGSIERLDMWIDQQDYTVLQYDTYYSSGQLQVSLTYTLSGGYRVVHSMLARFDFSGLARGTARVTYSACKFNQGLSDQLFLGP